MSDNKYSLEVNFIIPRYEVRGITIEGVQQGQTLEGEVILKPYVDMNCRGVWMEIGYMERGQGSHEENRMLENMIFEGSLQQNRPLSHHILFKIPENAPPTYKGEIVEIAWFVRIRIDIPFWFDKREEFEFMVIPRFAKIKDDIDFKKLPKDVYSMRKALALQSREIISSTMESMEKEQ